MDDWMFTSKGIYGHLTNCEALVKLIGNVLDDKDIDDAEAGARIRVLYHGYKIAEEANKHVNARI